MIRLGLKMLFGDRAKLFGLIMGVTLASTVITQQGAIFSGIMTRTFSLINDVAIPDLWVMDPKVQYIDDVKPLQDTELYRVRGVPGVAWAVPFYKGQIRARLETGLFQNCILIGIDDATLIGGPANMTDGALADLRRADGVIVDVISAGTRLARAPEFPGGPSRPLRVGDSIELNDHRAVVVGLCKASRTFQSQPTIYTTYSRATTFAPRERKLLTFVLAGVARGADPDRVRSAIFERTGLASYSGDQFRWKTVEYFIRYTGIPINFGIAVSLGFLVGTVITGFMFFSFTLDNLRYFGTLKAMGATDGRLLLMVIVQALTVGVLGYGMGIGITSWFGRSMKDTALAFRLPWQLLFVAGAATFVICTLSAMLSMRRVFTLEPAVVFKT